jgi:hypothetical protein
MGGGSLEQASGQRLVEPGSVPVKVPNKLQTPRLSSLVNGSTSTIHWTRPESCPQEVQVSLPTSATNPYLYESLRIIPPATRSLLCINNDRNVIIILHYWTAFALSLYLISSRVCSPYLVRHGISLYAVGVYR